MRQSRHWSRRLNRSIRSYWTNSKGPSLPAGGHDMERECFLSILVALLCGITMLACGWWPARDAGGGSARHLERLRWKWIWLPLAPASIIAASLCGWALAEPDPTPEKASMLLILASVPFALLFGRATLRAVWSLVREEGDVVTATVGLLRPWVLFSPHLARAISDRPAMAMAAGAEAIPALDSRSRTRA